MDLAGQRLLVTGGGSGIGRAIALGAAAAGARVVVCGRREDLLQAVAADAEGKEMHAVRADVADSASVVALIRSVAALLGGIDGVVQAAGVHAIGASVDLGDDELERVLQTNLVGTFRVAREAALRMQQAQHGSIVNVSSLSALGGFPGRLAYAVSKAGVIGLTQTLAAEWGHLGIRVNALVPGFVHTPIQDQLVARGRLDLDALVHRTPLGRRAEPEDMVEPALFLLSDAARFVTGECLVVDGGYRSFLGPIDRYAGTPTAESGGQ